MTDEPTYNELVKQLTVLTNDADTWKTSEEHAKEIERSKILLNRVVTKLCCSNCVYSSLDRENIISCDWAVLHKDKIPMWMGPFSKIVNPDEADECDIFQRKVKLDE